MIPLKKEGTFISEADYLEGELYAEFKSEYIDGHISAMVGASRKHNRISSNLVRFFGNHLEEIPCDVFQSDFKVKVGTNFFYPDVLVTCDENEYYTEKPTIIIEVLSPSTCNRDRSFKLNVYKQIPSLIEYVMIEQDKYFIEVHQRVSGVWNYKTYTSGDDLHFSSIDLTLSVDAIFRNVNIVDMVNNS